MANNIDQAAKSIETKEDAVRNALKSNNEIGAVLAFEKLSAEVRTIQKGETAALVFAKVHDDDTTKGKDTFVSIGDYGDLSIKRNVAEKMGSLSDKNDDAITMAHLNDHFKLFGRPTDPRTPAEAVKADAGYISHDPNSVAHLQERLFNLKAAGKGSGIAFKYVNMLNDELEKQGSNYKINLSPFRSKNKDENSWRHFTVENKSTGESEKRVITPPDAAALSAN